MISALKSKILLVRVTVKSPLYVCLTEGCPRCEFQLFRYLVRLNCTSVVQQLILSEFAYRPNKIKKTMYFCINFEK